MKSSSSFITPFEYDRILYFSPFFVFNYNACYPFSSTFLYSSSPSIPIIVKGFKFYSQIIIQHRFFNSFSFKSNPVLFFLFRFSQSSRFDLNFSYSWLSRFYFYSNFVSILSYFNFFYLIKNPSSKLTHRIIFFFTFSMSPIPSKTLVISYILLFSTDKNSSRLFKLT